MEARFALRDDLAWEVLTEHVSRSFGIEEDGDRVLRQQLFDTFDWRLYGRGWGLSLEDGTISLLEFQSGKCIASIPWRRKAPTSWSDFMAESLRNRLLPVIDIRALLRRVDVHKDVRIFRILNQDEKTVSRLSFETIRIAGKPARPAFRRCVLVPVRGYPKAFAGLRKAVIDAGTTPLKSTVLDLYDICRLTPGDYPSKIRTRLDPRWPTDRALKKILSDLFRTMRANEHGIIKDIDTEFLHDFRVSVRRTRSALSQVKDVFSSDVTDAWKMRFAELGKSTNRLRDLDVYLLAEASYRRMLPDDLKGGLDPVFASLKGERIAEHQNVVRVLKSAPFSDLTASWDAFLDHETPDEAAGTHAATPVIETAVNHVGRAYKKVVRLGSRIDEATPDEKLHRLRIACKKLRYLLEFFNSLFSQKDIEFLIGQLKRLQDHLGRFNDLSVQQKHLRETFEALNSGGSRNITPAAALGGLITHLNLEQREVRKAFARRFEAFGSEQNRSAFHSLLHSDHAARNSTELHG